MMLQDYQQGKRATPGFLVLGDIVPYHDSHYRPPVRPHVSLSLGFLPITHSFKHPFPAILRGWPDCCPVEIYERVSDNSYKRFRAMETGKDDAVDLPDIERRSCGLPTLIRHTGLPFRFYGHCNFQSDTFFCISRYRFGAITPSFTAEEIISIIDDELVVLNSRGPNLSESLSLHG